MERYPYEPQPACHFSRGRGICRQIFPMQEDIRQMRLPSQASMACLSRRFPTLPISYQIAHHRQAQVFQIGQRRGRLHSRQ